jgi:predicted transcriptional regulator
MLEIAKEGSLKTQIMYRANLSFNQLNDYLDFLLDNGLIMQTSRTGGDCKEVYVITKKGVEYLQVHSKLVRLLKP